MQTEQTTFELRRAHMVNAHIAGRGVRHPALLEAMRQLPREEFVEPGFEESAYQDRPLPIGEGQTISQPYIVALMVEAAGIEPGDAVLEVGAGSGYAAAVLAMTVGESGRVYAIERHRALGDKARGRFARLGIDRINLRIGDGTSGWPDAAPFEAILVAAGAPVIPEKLKQQLAPGGRLIVPVGEQGGVQQLMRIVRRGDDRFSEEDLGAVRFVPLVSDEGSP